MIKIQGEVLSRAQVAAVLRETCRTDCDLVPAHVVRNLCSSHEVQRATIKTQATRLTECDRAIAALVPFAEAVRCDRVYPVNFQQKAEAALALAAGLGENRPKTCVWEYRAQEPGGYSYANHSGCGRVVDYFSGHWKYCPFCGAVLEEKR